MRLLAHEVLQHVPGRSSAKPSLLFLHGMLARRQNLRSFARLFVDSYEADAILVDHRGHGDSDAMIPPHTIQACAEDLRNLLVTLPVSPVGTVIGHSFGGKVAIEYSNIAQPVKACVVLDCPPGPWVDIDADRDSVARLLALLPRLTPVSSKAELANELEVTHGFSKMVAMWMTTNVKGHSWVFNIDTVNALMNDYVSLNLFPMLENIKTPQVLVFGC